MSQKQYVFEISWEVCNMVGGIHTVLQSKAAEMLARYGERYICVGPNIPHRSSEVPVFREEVWDEDIYRILSAGDNKRVSFRMGRWLIPGEPRCLLVNFRELIDQKDRFYARLWELYGVNSLFGAYDYMEPTIFSYGAGQIIEKIFTQYLLPQEYAAVTHAHEWMCGAALLYLRDTTPEIGTVFTTHATILGRSLSSSDREVTLVEKLNGKNPDELAKFHQIEAKHSMEKACAKFSDVFTTVSDITAQEAELILGRRPEVVSNGLGVDVPPRELRDGKVKEKNRRELLEIIRSTTGCRYDSEKTIVIVSSGRYEFHNKGFDLFWESVARARDEGLIPHGMRVLALLMSPRDHGPRQQFRGRPLLSTHELSYVDDPSLAFLSAAGFANHPEDRAHAVYMPLYLDGHDSTLPQTYWQLLSGADLAIFPSWYEPWGYTPHEAVALGIPTITTDLAGFGAWAAKQGAPNETGVQIVVRTGSGTHHSVKNLARVIGETLARGRQGLQELGQKAYQTSLKAQWSSFLSGYLTAYSRATDLGLGRTRAPGYDRFRGFSLGQFTNATEHGPDRAHTRILNMVSSFPPAVRELLVHVRKSIAWSWDPYIHYVMAKIDADLWHRCHHDPQIFLREADETHIERLLSDKKVNVLFEQIREAATQKPPVPPEVAYFCVEYGIVEKLRIYSGGLGMLAGDHLKTAADMKIPLSAFGLYYRYGYFRQEVSSEGHQQAHYHRSELQDLPLELVTDKDGKTLLLSVESGEQTIFFKTWVLNIKGVRLYLIDTDVEENSREVRLITDRLYNTEHGKRIMQEWVLSQGGLLLIRALGIDPRVYHMNEGHTAFLVLGRIAEYIHQGLSFEEALSLVRQSTLFTSHTPVPAGHDVFPSDQAWSLVEPFCRRRNMDPQRIMELGRGVSHGPSSIFSMTGLAARGSHNINGVSQIHKDVTRRMFAPMFPHVSFAEVPVHGVTNGVHIPSWLHSDWKEYFFDNVAKDWPERLLDHNLWGGLNQHSLEVIRDQKRTLKRKLVEFLKTNLRAHLLEQGSLHPEMAAVLGNLSEKTLIITHAKRLASYKRADLILQDLEGIKKVLNQGVEVLFIYSGKAHPADGIGQDILRRISERARHPELRGHVLFLENYDMNVARHLMSGADIWLNTPIRPLEACGTSGMKAGINGTLNMSVADGWWPEAYNGKNGWMIGEIEDVFDENMQSLRDRLEIYHLLIHDVIPLYRASLQGDLEWYRMVRESIATHIPFVAAQRMLNEYSDLFYKPAGLRREVLSEKKFEVLKKLNERRNVIERHWNEVQFEAASIHGVLGVSMVRAKTFKLEVEVKHPGLSAEMLDVQAIFVRVDAIDKRHETVVHLDCLSGHDGNSHWKLVGSQQPTGEYSLKVRVLPKAFQAGKGPAIELDLNRVTWL